MILKLKFEPGFDTRASPDGGVPLDEVILTINTPGSCVHCKTPFEDIPRGERFIFDNLTVAEDGTGRGDLICHRCAEKDLEKKTVDV